MPSVAREGRSKKGAVPEWAWTLQVLYCKQIRGIEPLPLDSPLNREAGSSLSVYSNSKTEHSYNLHFTLPFEWNCEKKNSRILRGNKEWKRDWNDDLACLVVYINFLPLVYYRLVHRRKCPCRGSTTKKKRQLNKSSSGILIGNFKWSACSKWCLFLPSLQGR